MELAEVGKRLKAVRERHLHLRTKEMAAALARLGVETSDASVSRYETGTRMPPADYIWGVSMLAGISAHWLLTGEGGMERWSESNLETFYNRVAALVDQIRERGEAEDPPGEPPLPRMDAGILRPMARPKQRRRANESGG